MTRSLPHRTRTLAVGIAGIGIVGALAGCSTGATASSGGSVSNASYKDGTYTEDGNYSSPGGPETITVKLTLAKNVVTAVTVTPHATSGNAKQYQTDFAGGISDAVVGKKIDTLSVSRVAGSSLTSTGFNAALKAIKADAS